jgi:hypothetical protein
MQITGNSEGKTPEINPCKNVFVKGMEDEAHRVWVTRHLFHLDHAPRYRAGDDFADRTTRAIFEEHERLHDETGVWHQHARPWRVFSYSGSAWSLYGKQESGEQERQSMSERRSLELTVTVVSDDPYPDAVLGKMGKRVWLTDFAGRSGATLKVAKVERADGQPIGLESEFEQWWRDTRLDGEDDDEDKKDWARAAFMYAAAKYAKEDKA